MIRLRSALAAAALAAGATLILGTPAMAQGADRDCPDFPTQQQAQAALESRAGDPERLDGNKDGVACESEFGTTGAQSGSAGDESGAGDEQVSDVPSGSADAGGGSTAGMPVGLVTAGGLTLLGAGGLGAVAVARRGRARHETV